MTANFQGLNIKTENTKKIIKRKVKIFTTSQNIAKPKLDTAKCSNFGGEY